MEKVLVVVGASLGGGVGWWIGEAGGMMTAFLLSVVGTAAGVYGARRFVRDYLE